ncbi:hypothetical protein D3C87_1321350 [compost metagenome]
MKTGLMPNISSFAVISLLCCFEIVENIGNELLVWSSLFSEDSSAVVGSASISSVSLNLECMVPVIVATIAE